MPHNLPVDSIPCLKIDTLNRKDTLWKPLSAISSRLVSALAFLVVLTAFPGSARAQGLEVSGGWTHITGDFGTSGVDLGAAWWFTHRVTIAANYDSSWNDSTLGVFAFTQVGAIAVKSHLQNFIVGPRIFFTTQWTNKHKLDPFGEAQFGLSHLSQKVAQANAPSVSASDTAFTWMLGGGAEYLLTTHWSGRANFDLLRTHFSNEAQNHFRLVLGITYTFGERGIAKSTK